MIKPVLMLKFDESSPWLLSKEVKYLVEHKDAFSTASNREYKLNVGDQIYCLPDVSIPRFKLKMKAEALGISFIRSSEKADYIIINSLSNNRSAATLSNQEVQYLSFHKLIDRGSALLTATSNKTEEYNIFYNEVIKCMDTMSVLISTEDKESFSNAVKMKFGKYLWLGYGFQIVNYLSLKNPSLLSKLRQQSDLLNYIYEDSIIITDDKMDELQAMFDSGHDDNIVLAMEMMANSNYEESILNNYILLTKNLQKISNLRESGHRNFQNFLQFYGLDLRRMTSNIRNSDVDYIAGLMKDYGKLSEESMTKILQYYADTHNQYIGKFCNSMLIPNSDIEYDNGSR